MAGASPTTFCGCSHPCQGAGWLRQHAVVRSMHSEGWLVVLPAQPRLGPAKLVLPGACASYASKTQRQLGLVEPSKSHCLLPPKPLPAAPHRRASHHAHWLSVPCPPLSLQAGLGLVVPSLPGRAALSVELSAVQPPFLLGRVPGRWMWLSVGWGCVSSQSHFWLHL